MYTNPLITSNYLYYIEHPSVPSINISLNTVSTSNAQTAAAAYLTESPVSGTSLAYKTEVLRLISQRDYVRDRFEKDVCGESITTTSGLLSYTGSLSKIDLVRNEYSANEKSNEVFAEASLNNNLYSAVGLTKIEANFKRLFSTIMVKDDLSGLIYNTYLDPVEYDARKIEVINASLTGHDQYFKSEDMAVDPSKTYYSRNGQIFSQVESPSGSPKENGHYEKNQNQVNFLIEAPSAESTSRIYNSWNVNYIQTSDTIAQSGKLYYTKSEDAYTVANVTEGQALDGTYYEEKFLAANNSKQYTLRYNSTDSHWYIATITEVESTITIGPEILISKDIDANSIIWTDANK